METLDGPPIRPIEDVVREHVEETLALHGPAVPKWRIAAELGISDHTLKRWLKEWSGGESLTRDRR